MKHLFLYGGIALIGFTLWKKRQDTASVGSAGLTQPTGISVSPATLVVPGASSQGCNTCDQISGLGGDARISASAPADSPSAVSHAIMREDFEHAMPVSMSSSSL